MLLPFIAFFLIFDHLLMLNANVNGNEYCGGSGWSLWKGNCYKAFTAPNSLFFSEAEQICQSASAHAASVHSADENRFIAEVARENFQALSGSQNLPGFNRTDHMDTILAGFYLGYHRVAEDDGSKRYKCYNTDGTAMDFAQVPESRDGTKPESLASLGYPWNGHNPKDVYFPNGKAMACDCVELLDWPGRYGTWNDVPCAFLKLSGVVCKKPAKCIEQKMI